MSLTAALIGGAAALLGGRASNKANAKQAESQQAFQADQVRQQMAFQDEGIREQMDFQREQNQKAMDFSERMSSTAHQREIQDLRLAGLNPILSGTGGMGAHSAQGVSSAGASPTGAAAPGSKAEMRNIVADGSNSALAAGHLAQVLADLDVKQAQADNIKAQTVTEMNRPENVAAETTLKKLQGNTEAYRPEVEKWRGVEHKAGAYRGFAESNAIEGYRMDLSEAQRRLADIQARLTGSSAVSAGVKAKLDEAYSEIERQIGMAEGATSAVRNVIPGLNLFKGRK